jgi:hypothetical protein
VAGHPRSLGAVPPPNERSKIYMPKIGRPAAAVTAAILALRLLIPDAFAQGTQGSEVIIQLRVSGNPDALVPVRTCVAGKLSQMPDVKVADVSTEGVRFVVDVVVSNMATTISLRVW